jgi:hypothetical protein
MGYSIVNAERLRWQLRAHIILAQLLDAAIRQDLPAIAWTIATTGAITGTVNGLGVTADEQRLQFDAWVAYLGAERTERTRRDGSATLYAKFEAAGETAGAIRAELVPPLDGDL